MRPPNERRLMGRSMKIAIRKLDKRQVAGWIAVSLSTAITCFWAFWGILENFHEGWYSSSLLSNLGLMFVQYLSPMLVFMGVTLISIAWPRFGAGLHLLLVLLATWFFQALSNPILFVLILPVVGIGGLYGYGRPRPVRPALFLAGGLPLLVLVLAGVAPAVRVSQRFYDGNLQARSVPGNGVELVWAPDGPGWPRTGADWVAARETCRHLSDDGLRVLPVLQEIWRLPTVAEAVRSMARHGRNSGGVWEAENARAVYQTKPDKESPLWNPYAQVIYWWTATEVDEERAFIIVYDGKVWPRSKTLRPAYLGFRCVK